MNVRSPEQVSSDATFEQAQQATVVADEAAGLSKKSTSLSALVNKSNTADSSDKAAQSQSQPATNDVLCPTVDGQSAESTLVADPTSGTRRQPSVPGAHHVAPTHGRHVEGALLFADVYFDTIATGAVARLPCPFRGSRFVCVSGQCIMFSPCLTAIFLYALTIKKMTQLPRKITNISFDSLLFNHLMQQMEMKTSVT